jgi:hypothetical protein
LLDFLPDTECEFPWDAAHMTGGTAGAGPGDGSHRWLCSIWRECGQDELTPINRAYGNFDAAFG